MRRLLLKNGNEVHLTPKAFDLLLLLGNEAPRVVRKDELHQRLWSGTFVSDATLVGLIKEVRRALDDRQAKAPLIRTAHGVGYAFAGDLQRVITPADGKNLIGREPASTVLLDATGISRRHARILIDATRAVLQDLGSKNGTMLNDAPISRRVPLHDGDRIQIGPLVVVYHASASGMSTETIVRSAT
jgi:DNA-binding winged helix-turn-helix (wHTH) protein